MILLTALVAYQSVQAADYFPLAEGTVWTYAVSGPGSEQRVTDRAGAAVTIDGRLATPMLPNATESAVGVEFYRVDGDTVFIVAYAPDKPLPNPVPILKVGAGKVRWRYEGDTVAVFGPARQVMSCESSPGKPRDVLGKRVETVEVTLDVTISAGQSTLKSKQKAVYGKGIGLIEFSDDSRLGKEQGKTKLTLVDFKPPKVPATRS